ncbi:DUF3923 family protein [Alteribacter aurantiacus]|uniref:DUF3923 family protein n=1 Tax=Alteribacter aurantiacus TaxID=254410 RepID=UPI0003FB6BE9|nr:DUF3923 family protein [Alteribacter aurantiacus]
MKASWVLWWMTNAFWMALYLAGTLFVFMREVDGTGAVQTPGIKFISFGVLTVAFLIPLSFQMVWLGIHLFVGNQKKSYKKSA